MAPRSFTFLLGSARQDGNTELLAREAASHLPEGTPQTWLRLTDLHLPPFQDLRHTGDGTYPQPEGHEKTLFDATLGATDLVIATPLYWYTMSAPVKVYLDYWSAWLRVPGADFRANMAGRTLWTITALSGAAPMAEPLAGTMKLTAGYMGMRWGGLLLGNGTRPGHVLDDAEALAAAKTFFAG
ncbi:flavodoxin family protein [Longispora albida]|uniref:flavodoxin family protein n=1 Tax=Longispora albida TaxID=203523 RepID=UPI000368C218|nr:NAD(P)H-dependent oxidoreductase [Longispora albida]